MARFGADVIFKGGSGQAYEFELWELASVWARVPAVFIVTRKEYNERGIGVYPIIYCCETENLGEYFLSTSVLGQLEREGAKLVCVRRETNKQIREEIVNDILGREQVPKKEEKPSWLKKRWRSFLD